MMEGATLSDQAAGTGSRGAGKHSRLERVHLDFFDLAPTIGLHI